MPWVCLKCKFKTNTFPGEECPDCGGAIEEKEEEIDWEGENEENKNDDVVM